MHIDYSIKSQRIQAVKSADALNTIEGISISDYAKELSQQWVNGEISGEEMKSLLLEHHLKIASEEDFV